MSAPIDDGRDEESELENSCRSDRAESNPIWEGMEPVSLFICTVKVSSLVKTPIQVGIVFVSRLELKSRIARPVRCWREDGREEVRELLPKLREVRWVNRPIEEGIEEEKEQARESSSMFVKKPIVEGMLPVNMSP